jgi:hypothetical protein
MEDLTWLAITAALGAIAFLYLRLLGGPGPESGGEQGS